MRGAAATNARTHSFCADNVEGFAPQLASQSRLCSTSNCSPSANQSKRPCRASSSVSQLQKDGRLLGIRRDGLSSLYKAPMLDDQLHARPAKTDGNRAGSVATTA